MDDINCFYQIWSHFELGTGFGQCFETQLSLLTAFVDGDHPHQGVKADMMSMLPVKRSHQAGALLQLSQLSQLAGVDVATGWLIGKKYNKERLYYKHWLLLQLLYL